MIKLYTQPGCTRCPGVIRYLNSKVGEGNYEILDVSANVEALDHLQNTLGAASTPVVETDKGHHIGNNQKEIAALL